MARLVMLALCLWAMVHGAHGQSTDSLSRVSMTFPEAKALLFKENLSVLAAYYDIDIAEAELMQEKLWNNPYFNWNQDLYSVELNQYFNYKNQKLIQVDMAFSIAGRHTNAVKLAKINVELNRLLLQEVLRSLYYEMGERFYTLYSLQQTEELYTQILERFQVLIQNAENRYKVGAIPLNELTRLKSELIAVRSQAIANKNEIFSEMASLKTLLNIQDQRYILAKVNPLSDSVKVDYETMLASALGTRPDLELSRKQVKYEEQNVKLQKSLAIPNMQVGYQPTDKGSNYVRPYTGLVVEFFIPLFDRNQGNIQAAKTKVLQSQLGVAQGENLVRNQVYQSFQQWKNAKEGHKQFSPEFLKTMEELNRNANTNFEKKNINLLEYIDLQRIYIDNQLQYIDSQNQLLKSINLINFTVGKDLL